MNVNIERSAFVKSIVFYSNFNDDACAHLRLFGPMKQLGVHVISGKEENGRIIPERVELGDLVLIQRDFPRNVDAYEKVINAAREKNKPVIFDIDDLLFQLPVNHPERIKQHYTTALLPMLDALQEADYVTVTTQKLKEIVSLYNQNVFILPNYFDDSIWNFRAPIVKDPNKPVIIGYMGSESHQPDIELITPVLLNILAMFSERVVIHFWGINPSKELANHPQVKWIPPQTYNYAAFAKYFQTQSADVFIAPLVQNEFNAAKSPLKFFEYAALGAPGVYSRIAPFECIIDHGINGQLASTNEEWEDNIALLIKNPELRHQLAINAQETIRTNWLLSKNISVWEDAYAKIVSTAKKNLPNQNDLIKPISHQYYRYIEAKGQELAQKNIEIQSKEEALQSLNKEIQSKEELLQSLNYELAEIKASKAWKLALLIRKTRLVLLPINSRRAKMAGLLFRWVQGEKIRFFRKGSVSTDLNINSIISTNIIDCSRIKIHEENIDVIICVHNAIQDVQKCLESIIAHTTDPFSIIIIDDGSDEPTRNYLSAFSETEPRCTLIRNDVAKGYTFAANIGMKASHSQYLVLLNSDTIVGPEWLDRMYRAITMSNQNGIVGPLSNTASWQSIPTLSENGDWAVNSLPSNISPVEMSQLITKYSGCILPEVSLLNGFCLMIRKALLSEIGYFDEENFGQGYGEEDDFTLRAGNAGWKKVIADDVYIYHAQSKSYSHSRRHSLSKISGEKLRLKHGTEILSNSIASMNPNRVIEGIRSRTNVIFDREETIRTGQQRYSGKKLLFILPVIDAGGGANVILDEARSMIKMGVDVKIFNLSEYRTGFLNSYPYMDIPLIFGKPQDLSRIAPSFDAIIASANYSVEWIKPLEQQNIILGYYIQGFEPLMYPLGSLEANQALATYTMINDCKRFTKTEWTRQMVLSHTGVNSDVVGISVNIDLFRPRDTIPYGTKPVNIAAMIRPASSYRNPFLTMSILKKIKEKYGREVDIWLFGANDIRDIVDPKLLNFQWKQFGKLTQYQVASMMSKADIFTDFSSHQAMGLTALEAMSAGCSVIVPKNGGATEFVKNRINGIVVDTTNTHDSQMALEELIENDNLRKELQIAGLRDVVQYFPEKVSFGILKSLFGE